MIPASLYGYLYVCPFFIPLAMSQGFRIPASLEVAMSPLGGILGSGSFLLALMCSNLILKLWKNAATLLTLENLSLFLICLAVSNS